MEFIPVEIQRYAERYTSPEDPFLQKINEETYSSHTHPQMLSGHLQGVFLEMLSRLKAPKYILEIGTFMGYSTLALAKGLAEGGELHSVDINPADMEKAKNNISGSGTKANIILHTGNALDLIPRLEKTWDLVFIDADKTGYINYYDLVLPVLHPKGLIIVDNVLFHGEVVKQPLKGKNAKAIHEFNEYIKNDDRTIKVMLTVRDALLLIMKK